MKIKVYECGHQVLALNKRDAQRKLELEFGERFSLRKIKRFKGPFKLSDDCGETWRTVNEEEYCQIVTTSGEDIVAEL